MSFLRHAHADHLVIDQVRRHADQRQVATSLADRFVRRRVGIRCVKPSKATLSPSRTFASTAAARSRNSAIAGPPSAFSGWGLLARIRLDIKPSQTVFVLSQLSAPRNARIEGMEKGRSGRSAAAWRNAVMGGGAQCGW